MNERCNQILLSIINNEDYITISQLSSMFNVSQRTIRYDLDTIDEFLRDNNCELLVRKQKLGVGFVKDINKKNKIVKIIGNQELSFYALGKEERINIMISQILQSRDFIKIDSLVEKTQTSRATISNDIKYIKKWFKEKNIKLTAVPKKGFIVEGKEYFIRKALLEVITNSIDIDTYERNPQKSQNTRFNFSLYKEVEEFFKEINLDLIKTFLENAEKELEIVLTDEAFTNLFINIAYSIKRIKEGKSIVETKNHDSIIETKEFKVIKRLSKKIEDEYKIKINNEEIKFIAIELLGSSLTNCNQRISENWVEINLIVKDFIEAISLQEEIDLLNDKQLFLGIVNHLRPAIYRMKNNIILVNPILEEIKNKYAKIFLELKKCVYLLEEALGCKFNESELGYLTIHFAAALERNKTIKSSKKNVVIVCSEGIGTSQMIVSTIVKRFKVNIVEVTTKRYLHKVIAENKVDLIISTIQLNTKIKTIIVNPIISSDDIKLLKEAIEEIEEEDREIKSFIETIRKSCTINDEERLIYDLRKLLNYKDEIMIKERYKPMLKEVITENEILTNVEAKDWKEAVRIGGQLLFKAGKIEERYIEEMIQNVEENGAYIVIAPKIAMPHARPEKGAKDIGLSLITLKNPINFGNPVNDPVSLVISLCAVDHSSHLIALSELMDILSNEEKVKYILSEMDPNKIIKLIKEV
ncbi:BglG family transcription antiterminator [Clostridium swellfunianum]|uniref:BglG family transcription antiterminator n=1 Tax=Clostridium swellfunianum TaxID=1367462 RepID=UPI00202FADB6|nr:BglG family transcription antiterminator [Clostridium swellfunianum]MCM0650134.1 BglG family transcription antiterminator [Clostridium swellfunianum]